MKTLLIGIIALLLLNSCALIKLQKDLDIIEAKGAFGGVVTHPEHDNSSNIIVVFDENHSIAAYKKMHPDDTYYVFILPPNKIYRIFAYNDQDKDINYDKQEPAGKWLNPQNITIKPGGFYEVPKIVINRQNTIPPQYAKNIDKASKKQTNNMVLRSGVVVDIKKPIFDQEHGEKGLWTPIELFKEAGSGVYFLEKYDPEKIPILFIHGIAGFPQSWETFFKKIDREKFQPWFFHYPSGYYIKDNALNLDLIMAELYAKYKFKKLFIVSHSMGGLLASSFIVNSVIKDKAPYVKLFISLSTPWNGMKQAAFGVKYSPSVAPCWEELQTGSKYLKSLHSFNIAQAVPFYNFFSYKGTSVPYNDGAISLKSQLYLESQKTAIKNLGFYLTHSQMLHSTEVISTCNKLFLKHANQPKNKH